MGWYKIALPRPLLHLALSHTRFHRLVDFLLARGDSDFVRSPSFFYSYIALRVSRRAMRNLLLLLVSLTVVAD